MIIHIYKYILYCFSKSLPNSGTGPISKFRYLINTPTAIRKSFDPSVRYDKTELVIKYLRWLLPLSRCMYTYFIFFFLYSFHIFEPAEHTLLDFIDYQVCLNIPFTIFPALTVISISTLYKTKIHNLIQLFEQFYTYQYPTKWSRSMYEWLHR